MSTWYNLKTYLPTSKVRMLLLCSFILLMLTQVILGFKYFEDYLVILIFILFLNDHFYKLKHPENVFMLRHEKKIRTVMSFLIVLILLLPFVFDYLHLNTAKQILIYKLGFILWAQIFLIDSFIHYRETHSKKWLIFTNTAVMMIIFGAFII